MKMIFGLATILTTFTLTAANARPSYTSCSNGKIEKVGDAHFQVDILEDGIEFFPYEGSFTVDATDIKYKGNTFSIVNKVVKFTSEGEESSSIINATLKLNAKRTKLNLVISYDRGPKRTHLMTCVNK